MTDAAPTSRFRLLSPRSDGARYSRVALSAHPDGSLTLVSHHMGGSLEAAWGLDDHELELSIAPDQVAALALALLAERLGGDAAAATELAALCDDLGVRYRLARWT